MDNANKYIRPDPRPHIDHEKEKLQRRIWKKGLELLEKGYAKEFLKFMEDADISSEQRERAREIVKRHYRL